MVNITIGQYYPASSKVHVLDARLKIIVMLAYITSLFFITNFVGYFAVFLGVAVVVKVSLVPIKFLLRGIKSIFFIILFTAVLNVLFTYGEDVIFSFWRIVITHEGVMFAIKMVIRLTLLVVGSSLLTLTTSSMELTDGIESLLKPLKKIGVPAHEIAMMMTIALRFIPTLMEEMDKIVKAQTARGAEFETGGLIKKAKSLIPILVPLFISAFRRADDLALAMEARCYNGDNNRTRMKQLKLCNRDFYAIVLVTLFLGIVIATRFVNII